MTRLDVRMRSLAERMIGQYGKAMTLRKIAEGAYDPSAGGVTTTPTDYAIFGSVAQPSRTAFESGTANVGDASVMVAAKGLTARPEVSDRLVIDDALWTIVAIADTYSGSEIAMYTLICRRS